MSQVKSNYSVLVFSFCSCVIFLLELILYAEGKVKYCAEAILRSLMKKIAYLTSYSSIRSPRFSEIYLLI